MKDSKKKKRRKQEKKRRLYDILGISRNSSQEQIRSAYKALALRLHPDKNPTNSTSTAAFQELREAYDVLSDPNKRSKYDSATARVHFPKPKPRCKPEPCPPSPEPSYTGRRRSAAFTMTDLDFGFSLDDDLKVFDEYETGMKRAAWRRWKAAEWGRRKGERMSS